MNNVSDSIAVVSNLRQLESWGVLNRDGIFYATAPVCGDDLPFEVALHGVSSESEAHQAIALFARADTTLPARVAL